MEKPIDKKVVDTLALVIASKTGNDDNYALVARKVIDDYVGAKKIVLQYIESTERAAKKRTKDEKEKKAADKRLKKSSEKVAKKKDK